MKLGEVKLGAHYGAVETGRGRGATIPRQVEAVKIEAVEERYWSEYTGDHDVRNVRKVVVKVLDSPSLREEGYGGLRGAKKGETFTLDARQLVAPWTTLRGPIQAQHKREQEARETVESFEKRLRALGFRDDGTTHVYASGDDPKRAHLSFYNTRGVEKILALAEAGLTKQRRKR